MTKGEIFSKEFKNIKNLHVLHLNWSYFIITDYVYLLIILYMLFNLNWCNGSKKHVLSTLGSLFNTRLWWRIRTFTRMEVPKYDFLWFYEKCKKMVNLVQRVINFLSKSNTCTDTWSSPNKTNTCEINTLHKIETKKWGPTHKIKLQAQTQYQRNSKKLLVLVQVAGEFFRLNCVFHNRIS